MTTHRRYQIAILATAALVLLVRPDAMLLMAGMLLLAAVALGVRVHPHHHHRHA